MEGGGKSYLRMKLLWWTNEHVSYPSSDINLLCISVTYKFSILIHYKSEKFLIFQNELIKAYSSTFLSARTTDTQAQITDLHTWIYSVPGFLERPVKLCLFFLKNIISYFPLASYEWFVFSRFINSVLSEWAISCTEDITKGLI